MTENDFLDLLASKPEAVQFTDTMAVIDNYYTYSPCAFRNGEQHNEAGQNEGSCKVFAFAQAHQLDPALTLQCFGDYYREDVLKHPDGNDHQNIRQFMQHGWAGVHFNGTALARREN